MSFYRVLLLLIALMCANSWAGNAGISYQGRILKPDGTPLENSNVQFRMQVRSPGAENCLLYEEMQTVNMLGSSGAFTITLNDGTGTRLDTPTYQVDRAFANRGTMTLDTTRCSSGSTYVPNVADGRKLIVYFKDSTMSAFEPFPIMNINYTPHSMYALESGRVGVFDSSNLLRAVDASGNPVSAPALNPTQLTNLTDLIAGTSTQYATTAQYNTVQNFAKSTLPTCAAGEVLKSNGTTFSCVTDATGSGGGGTVTAVTSANSYLSVATGTTTPALTLNVGTAANTVAAGDDSRITGALQSSAYAIDVADTTACTASEKPYWNTVSDKWMCAAIGSLNASAISAGTLATARLGSGTANSTTFLRGDGTWASPSGGGVSGLNTGYIPKATSSTSIGDSAIYETGGKVGIGTATPNYSLEVSDLAMIANGLNIGNISGNAGAGQLLDISQSSDTANSTVTNASISISGDPGISGMTANYQSLSSTARYSSTYNGLGGVSGIRASATKMGTGSLANGYGIQTYVNANAGTLTNAYGLQVQMSGAGTVTNGYGLYLGTMMGSSSKYALYSSDSTANSYFAGNVGIGTNAPTVPLTIKGPTSADAINVLNSTNTVIFKVRNTWDRGNLRLFSSTGTEMSSLYSDVNDGPMIYADGSAKNATDGATTLYGSGLGIRIPYVVGQENGVLFGNSSSIGSSVAGAAVTAYTSSVATYAIAGLHFKTNDTGTTLTTRMTIDPTGNIGIGTTSPVEKLEVNGGVKLGTTSSSNAGTIRWDGTNFSGFNGSAWVNFVPNPPASGACDTTNTYTVAGTYAYTVPASFGTITVKLWGAGGGGGGSNSSGSGNAGGSGGNSTVGSLSLFAGGGVGGSPGSTLPTLGVGGNGGTASGGTINTAGVAGSAAAAGGSGAGGTAPTGGGVGGVSQTSNSMAGNAGSSPGGGGGSGSYVEKTFTTATLAPGTTISDIVVGAAGTAGSGSSAGGAGGVGRISITCASAGAPVTGDRGILFVNSSNYATDSNFVYDASGNVGIGTSSPSQVLHINKNQNAATMVFVNNSNAGASTTSSFYASNGTDSTGLLQSGTGNNRLGALSTNAPGGLYIDAQNATGGINFRTGAGPTQRMIIDAGGNVGIGSTTPSYLLDVNGDANIASGSALRFGGTSVCTSIGCTSSSDRNLKENILPLQGALEKILKLQGVEYNYKDTARFTSKHQVGVIAQDVERVYPEVVNTDPDSGLKSVAYDHLIAPLIESVKTLYNRLLATENRQIAQDKVLQVQIRELASKADQTQITQLKSEVAAKDQKIKELEKRLEKIEKMLISK